METLGSSTSGVLRKNSRLHQDVQTVYFLNYELNDSPESESSILSPPLSSPRQRQTSTPAIPAARPTTPLKEIPSPPQKNFPTIRPPAFPISKFQSIIRTHSARSGGTDGLCPRPRPKFSITDFFSLSEVIPPQSLAQRVRLHRPHPGSRKGRKVAGQGRERWESTGFPAGPGAWGSNVTR